MYATERNQIVILIVNCTCMYFYVQWCVYIQILWNPLIVVTKKDSWISLVPFIHEFETQRVIEQFISALIELLNPQNYVSINQLCPREIWWILNWVYRINVDVAHVYTYDFDQVLYFYTYHYQTDKWRGFFYLSLFQRKYMTL